MGTTIESAEKLIAKLFTDEEEAYLILIGLNF